MPVLWDYVAPDFYGVTIYGDHILSPFNRENRRFYRYAVDALDDSTATLSFRARHVRNTQLVRGVANVDMRTGRIDKVTMEGEFDMIHFRSTVAMGGAGRGALMPSSSVTIADFKFMGNRVSSRFEAHFGCAATLPDSVDTRGDRQLVNSLRPVPLNSEERIVYASHDYKAAARADTQDSTASQRPDYIKEIGWDIIGENLIRSIHANTGNGYVRLSPIINPQYLSYSHSKGVSYKLKLGARYNFGRNAWIETNPYLGYNFKLREFYWDVPFSLFYSSRLNAHFDVSFGIDNRTGNRSVLEKIRQEHGYSPEEEERELSGKKLDLFDDHYVRIKNVVSPATWLTVETGVVTHRRHAVNPVEMESFGKPTKYKSFAPALGVKVQPWKRGPVVSVDYERGLKVNDVDMSYERWEADISMSHTMSHTQTLNMRLGGGFYTARGNNYFMDYTNFRDSNLPGGWNDDWTGNFQLLSPDLYNVSDYYLRGNVSYEAPLLAAAYVPLVGRYVERERVYWSGLSIAGTRYYSELGYGFTCRYASLGFFASFLNVTFQEFGCKFTFELFRRW